MSIFLQLLTQIETATAFLVNGYVSGDFKRDEICEDPEDEDATLDLYTYGERGLNGEYSITREQIENGKITEHGFVIDYHGETLDVVLLKPVSIA